jgi:multiple sugar transport system substrate-binding protein
MVEKFPKVLAAACVAALTVAVAACGSGGGPSGNDNASLPDKKIEGGAKVDVKAEPTGEISIAVPADAPGDIALRRKQAAAFEQKYPKVKVKITTIPSDGYDQKILTLIAGGKAPDIFGSGDVVIPTIVNRNYALDLKPYMEADGFDTKSFYPEVIDGLTYEGKIVGLTDNWDTQVMYYNRALFEKAGVEPPTADWTWDDYKAAAAKLTSGSGPNKVWGSLWQKWFVPTLDIVQAGGGSTYAADGKSCQLNSPEAVKGLTFLDELRKAGDDPGYVTQDARNTLGRTGDDVFKQGKAAMMIGDGRWASYDFATVKNLDWAVAPLPKGPAGRANFFHLAMNAIPSNSKNPNAAWKFLRFVTSPEGVEMGIDNVQGIPARESIAKSDAVSGAAISTEHDAYQPFIDSLPSAKRSPQLTNFFKYQDKIDRALQALWKGQKSPQDAADAACKAVDSELAKG